MPLITLVVKAPNQKVADQTVKCDVGWTVQMLKEHLSDVYPSKPVSAFTAGNETFNLILSWLLEVATGISQALAGLKILTSPVVRSLVKNRRPAGHHNPSPRPH